MNADSEFQTGVDTIFAWDLDGDGIYDDANGPTIEVDRDALSTNTSGNVAVMASTGKQFYERQIPLRIRTAAWQNSENRQDVDSDGLLTPRDALLVIHELNLRVGDRQRPICYPRFNSMTPSRF